MDDPAEGIEKNEGSEVDGEVEDDNFVPVEKLEDAIDPESLKPSTEDAAEGEAIESAEEGEGPKMVEVEDDSVQGFFEHKGSCFSVSVNPGDPDIVGSGGEDDRSFIWNARTGEKVAECGGHTDSVGAVGWNWDGSLFASGGLDGKVKIWDKLGVLQHTLEGPSGGINWLTWHPKGNALLAGSEDCSVWLWMASANKNVAVFFGHTESVECGAITADGKLCVSGSQDKTVKIWKPKESACAHTMEGYKFHKVSFDFSCFFLVMILVGSCC